ncbi:polysaccharide biosynthesis protein [Sulfuricystis multivorans]|uniref:polysaccharide biosynthesis protein n=1 Tax=Sulfuricystis multivorans TaxID=2211108 RepID=UPI000F83B220|nr:nucleoside-diphosphate sugar epimerase/dehydratase [Sulfuricystis multivorans]
MPFVKTTQLLLDLPRPAKRLVALAVDASLCVLTVWLAFYLRLDEWVRFFGDDQWRPQWAALGALVLALPIFVVTGLYRAIFRYAGMQALLAVAKAMFVYTLLYAALFTAIGVPGVPRTVGLIQPVLLLVAVGASRVFARYWLGEPYQNILRRAALPKVLIYGAGSAGRQLAAALAHSHEMKVVGFLDDDQHLQGGVMNGLPIHAPDDLPTLVAAQQIHDVLLAIPSASRRRRNEILERLRVAKVAVRTLPGVADLARGEVHVSDLREPNIDDLLGREPVAPEPGLLERNIRDKVVLITGAGGSIGSELCRQIAVLSPRRLLLVEISEYALYQIDRELRHLSPGFEPVPLIGSVADAERMGAILSSFRPETIYHAAAYKHVPLVEHNIAEGIRNNAFGTLNLASLAREHGVADFVLISTDKAVRPTNVMGASKRLAELILQALAAQGGMTRFTMVRFGNVLGSSGSVVPLFRKQIRDGGPVTLTHPEVTRYFMTIPEAAQLVIQAGALAGAANESGAVFVLDMGEAVKIIELARRMIELSGLTVRDEANPDGDIEIAITGLRPGEKLYEELLIGDDPQPTLHPRIMKAREHFLSWAELEPRLAALEAALAANDAPVIRQLLAQMVSGYQPTEAIADFVHCAKAVLA